MNPITIHSFDTTSNNSYAIYQTPAGALRVTFINGKVVSACFVENSSDAQTLPNDLEVQLSGTPFEILVWKVVMTIPVGTTISYQQLAHRVGKPTACRAVARAVARNPIALLVPCHRVIRKNGDLGGYAWSVDRKRVLLQHERLS